MCKTKPNVKELEQELKSYYRSVEMFASFEGKSEECEKKWCTFKKLFE